jgi:hypothetical protein
MVRAVCEPRRVAGTARSSRTRGWRGGTLGGASRARPKIRLRRIGRTPIALATEKACAYRAIDSSCSATTPRERCVYVGPPETRGSIGAASVRGSSAATGYCRPRAVCCRHFPICLERPLIDTAAHSVSRRNPLPTPTHADRYNSLIRRNTCRSRVARF